MMKFRTMKDGIDKYGKLLPDSERLTNFGKILRSTSLDELTRTYKCFKRRNESYRTKTITY